MSGSSSSLLACCSANGATFFPGSRLPLVRRSARHRRSDCRHSRLLLVVRTSSDVEAAQLFRDRWLSRTLNRSAPTLAAAVGETLLPAIAAPSSAYVAAARRRCSARARQPVTASYEAGLMLTSIERCLNFRKVLLHTSPKSMKSRPLFWISKNSTLCWRCAFRQ
jgi:hypothetical protein